VLGRPRRIGFAGRAAVDPLDEVDAFVPRGQSAGRRQEQDRPIRCICVREGPVTAGDCPRVELPDDLRQRTAAASLRGLDSDQRNAAFSTRLLHG